MKAYRFRLARLLELRRRTLDQAEAELAQALAAAWAAEERAARLERESAQLAASAHSKLSWSAREMIAAEVWREALGRRYREALGDAAKRRARIPALQGKVREARVGVRALESLDERRRREWSREADRQEEALASELFLARWTRERG